MELILFILLFLESNSISQYPVSPDKMFQNAEGPAIAGIAIVSLSYSGHCDFSFSTKLTSMFKLNV